MIIPLGDYEVDLRLERFALLAVVLYLLFSGKGMSILRQCSDLFRFVGGYLRFVSPQSDAHALITVCVLLIALTFSIRTALRKRNGH
jgi:hypothetical protein